MKGYKWRNIWVTWGEKRVYRILVMEPGGKQHLKDWEGDKWIALSCILRKYQGQEVAGVDSGLCSVVGFCFSNIEPSSFATSFFLMH